MTIVLDCLCAIALVLTGAWLSGGLPQRKPPRRHDTSPEDAAPAPADELSRDLAALLSYQSAPQRQDDEEE